MFDNKKIFILGMARSGYQAARVLAHHGCEIVLNDKNEMFCLEANTLPGMTPTSLLPQEAAAVGVNFNQLCEHLITISLKKYEV